MTVVYCNSKEIFCFVFRPYCDLPHFFNDGMCSGKATAIFQLDKQINLFAFGLIRLLVCISLLSLISIEPGFQSFIFRRAVNDRLEQDIKLFTLRIICGA